LDPGLRLFLRFILVPLGYLMAVAAGTCIILFGSWKAGTMMLSQNPDTATAASFAALVAGPVLFVVLAASMWLPSLVGILISEAFAIRSWIFHALNGAATAFLGWQLFGSIDSSGVPMNDPQYVLAAGLAGGFAYWAVTGWSAGFWKPVFARPAPPPALLPPAAASFPPPQAPALPSPASAGGTTEGPFNPPVQTKA
jgi:hypothetical protein